MKFKKKAMECELVCFVGLGDPLPDGVEIRYTTDGGVEVWNALHGSWIKLELGDYLNVSTPGDIYPIKAHVVTESYEPV